MESEELLKKLNDLESTHEKLHHELLYLDYLMRSVGFTDGLNTVKATAHELHLRNSEEE